MKTHLLLFALFFTFISEGMSNNFSTQKSDLSSNSECQPQFIALYEYNREIFGASFDKSGAIDSVLVSQTTYEYETKKVTGVTKLWYNNAFINESKSIIYMKNETKIDSMLAYSIDSVSNDWKMVSKMTWQWENDLNLENKIYGVDSLTGNLVAFMKTVYDYNTEKQVVSEVMSMFDTESTTWMEVSSDFYTYIDANTTVKVNKTKFPGTSIVFPSDSTVMNFENGILVSEIDYSYNNFTTGWEKLFKTEYGYNQKWMEIVCNEYSWDPEGQKWNRTGKDSTLYENDEKPLVDFSFETANNGQLLIHEKTFYNYQTGSGVADLFNREFQLKVYPNPTSSLAIVEVGNPINASLKIFSLKGEVLFSRRLTNKETSIQMENFKPGTYIVQVENNLKKQRQTLIVR